MVLQDVLSPCHALDIVGVARAAAKMNLPEHWTKDDIEGFGTRWRSDAISRCLGTSIAGA
jgi:hypothetical protein